MVENTKIEWTDHTFNPWTGCTRVSPGCDHCYAEAMSKRNPGSFGSWDPGASRKRTGLSYWHQPHRWNSSADFPNFCLAPSRASANEAARQGTDPGTENQQMPAKTARHARAATRTERRAANQNASLEAFLREKARFDAMLAEMQQMSEDHMGADPEGVLWTEAARLAYFNAKLQEITDSYFRRGEYAA
jgi:hypothetical protein